MADLVSGIVKTAEKTLATGGMDAVYIALGVVASAVIMPFILKLVPQLRAYNWLALMLLGIAVAYFGEGNMFIRSLGIGIATYGVLLVALPLANNLGDQVAVAVGQTIGQR